MSAMRFTEATFVFAGLNPTAFCQWASENFGADVTHMGQDCYRISLASRITSPTNNIWGAIHDIQSACLWVLRQPHLLAIPRAEGYAIQPWADWNDDQKRVFLTAVRMVSGTDDVNHGHIEQTIENLTARPVSVDDPDIHEFVSAVMADLSRRGGTDYPTQG